MTTKNTRGAAENTASSRGETEQLALWRGEFGARYIARNEPTPAALAMVTRMWARLLEPLAGRLPRSILEVGSNVGLNLRALRRLVEAELFAAEPNESARARLVADDVLPADHVLDAWAARLPLSNGAVDMSFTAGVLIHIAPDDLLASCREIHRVTSRFVGCVEYFSPNPEAIPYRGHEGQLFRRDFGRFWMENFRDLELVDCGFFWTGAGYIDDLTFWLFEKRGG